MIDAAYVDSLQIHLTPTYFITKIQGLGSPKSRANRSDKAQRHGQLDYTKFYGPRVIPVEGVAIGATPSLAWDAFDALKAAFALQDASPSHVFKFQRAGKAYLEQCTVTVDSELTPMIDRPVTVIPWGVTLVAADPRMYSSVLASASYDPTAILAGGGMVMPLTVIGGIVFSSTTITQLTLLNNGNFSTPVRLTITGPVVNPIVDNNTTGFSIYLSTTLGQTDTVIVDTADRSVLLNGASRPDLIDVQNTIWSDLTKGTNILAMRGSGMVSTQTSLTATFRDARI